MSVVTDSTRLASSSFFLSSQRKMSSIMKDFGLGAILSPSKWGIDGSGCVLYALRLEYLFP